MMTHGNFQRSGKLLFLFLLASWPALTGYTIKPQDKWVKLGDRTVNYTVDHSELTMDGLSSDLTAVRVKVKKGAINLHRCMVFYKGGQSEQLDVLNSIPAGQESKIIELPAPAKTVIKLVFTYDTKNRATQQVEVEVWGRQ